MCQSGHHGPMAERDELVLEAWSALKGVSWTIFHKFAASSERDATPAQMGVLHMLLQADAPLTPREIAQKLDVTPATITGALNALEVAGFIERARQSDDRRVVHVRVTPAGRVAAKRRRERMRAHLREAFGPLSDKELRQLAETLTRLAPPIHGPPGGYAHLLRADSAGRKPGVKAKTATATTTTTRARPSKRAP